MVKLRIYHICKTASLVLAFSLVLMIPFEAGRNIDMQGGLLIISGMLAWTAIALRFKYFVAKLEPLSLTLIGIIIFSGLLSTALNPNLTYDLIGAPLIRLGSLSIFACIGLGLLSLTVPAKKLITVVYILICTISVISIPYSLYQFDTTERIGGVFAQADILAVFCAFGFLLGIYVYQILNDKRKLVILGQLSLLAVLIMTQTRIPLILVFVLSIAWMLLRQKNLISHKTLLIFLTSILIIVVGIISLPSRITDVNFAKQSIDYRFSLQATALNQTINKPVLGYGLGNIADPLDCKYLQAENLQSTCEKNFFFNSSHNIYLDRVLGVGWVGGVAYLLLVILAVVKGIRGSNETRIITFCILLIGLYYLTNVTSLTLELFFWVLILQCLKVPNKTSRASA